MLTRGGVEESFATKNSAFTRSFCIRQGGKVLSLEAKSAFGRKMRFTGEGVDMTILPVHAFTRRATIVGHWDDDLMMAFGFWLTVLTWRRIASNNGGS